MMSKIFFLSFCVFIFESVHAQFVIYDESNSGISYNGVHCIGIRGNEKWIGTDYGLSVYNDTNWTTYYTSNSGIPDNNIRAIGFDSLGNVWVGTFTNGIGKFDGSNWDTLNMANSALPDNHVRAFAVDQLGNYWFGTLGGLVFYDGDTMIVYDEFNTPVMQSSNISDIKIDVNNTKWIATINGGLYRIDTGWTRYKINNSQIPDNTQLSLDIDADGKIWIACPAGGLGVFDGIDNWQSFNTLNSDITSNSLNCLDLNSDDHVYCGSIDEGLIYYEGGLNWSQYDSLNSNIPEHWITALKVDENDNVWVGFFNSGIAKLGDSTVGYIPYLPLNDEISVYPNPAKDFFYISFDAGTALNQLNLYDLSGRLIIELQNVFPSQKIMLPVLPAGVYFIKAVSEKNMFFKKVVIQ